MKIHPERGQAAALTILPEVEFDFSEDERSCASLGKTEVTAQALPEMPCELSHADNVPVLQVCISLRTGALPADAAVDVVRLCAAVNRLERSFSGAGLTPDDAVWESAASGGRVRIRFKPAQPAGAMDRLTRLVRTLNGTGKNLADAEALPYRSIEGCEAQIILPAA